MKITIYEAECYVGYSKPIFRGTSKEAIIAEIAKICRDDWKSPHAGGWEAYWADYRKKPEMGDVPPRVPSKDKEVVETYFWADPSEHEEERWISWDEYEVEVDLGAPYDVPVVIAGAITVIRTRGRRTKTLYTGDGANLDGTLMGDMPDHSDAMEALILALTAAGHPVHTPQFAEAVKAAMDGIANNSDTRTPTEIEEMERAVADAGYQINIDRMFDKWTINEWNADHWESVEGENLYETRDEAVVAAFGLIP